jgi:dihydroflavonol-4-reductase
MTKPTLVTGANGHLGNNLCRLLVERGERVRAMIRSSADPAPLAGLDVEIVHGDILKAADAAKAVENCVRVYHTAAGFLMWARDPERDIIRPSVEGTRNVLEAAAHAGVERVVYTSTTGTIGFATTPTQLDETHYNTDPHTHYVRGKIAAEQEAFAIAKRTGLPVVAIQPGLILGPRFWKVSESVRQIADFLNHGAPLYFEGGFGVVDVEDVARGAIQAMEKGRPGERYILSGEDLTVKGLFDLLAELTGLKAPTIKAPVPVVRALAGLMELAAKLTGARPMIDRSQVDEFAGKYAYFSSAKAQRELGYTYLSARQTVQRTITWLVEHGFVNERRRQVILKTVNA